jgi:hypothetical protein
MREVQHGSHTATLHCCGTCMASTTCTAAVITPCSIRVCLGQHSMGRSLYTCCLWAAHWQPHAASHGFVLLCNMAGNVFINRFEKSESV